MIRRFNFYIVWEITKLFSIALIAFTSLFMLVGVGKELVSQGLDFRAVLELIPYFLPISLQFALPATLLFAVCSVYGRISADNELMAMMSAGVPPIRFITPTLIASFALSLFAVWVNDIAVSWGEPGMNRVVMHSIEKVAYGWLSTQHAYESHSGFSIHVHGIGPDGKELISPTISTTPANGQEALTISARSARLSMDTEKEVLRIELTDSEVEGANGLTMLLPGTTVHEERLASTTRKGRASDHPSKVPIQHIGDAIQRASENIRDTQEILVARTAMALATGKYEWLANERTVESMNRVSATKSRMKRLSIEPWRRWASGFWCFFFVWVGIPVSIWMKSADHWTSFGSCFMPILLIYYPIFALGLDQAKAGTMPPVAVWLGNVVLLLVGGWWLRKIYRS